MEVIVQTVDVINGNGHLARGELEGSTSTLAGISWLLQVSSSPL
jgi:hypothetical protein